MDNYNLERFIDELLIPDLRKMVDHQLHYYAFAIICQAIEVLGSVFDQEDFEDFSVSKTRFRNGLRKFFKDQRYKNNQSLFYKAMRGPLIHQLRPGESILLSSEAKDKTPRNWHLKKEAESGRVYMVIEQFLEDFEEAFARFKKEVDKHSYLDSAKISSTFISVFHSSDELNQVASTGQAAQVDSQPLFSVFPSVTGNAHPDRPKE